MQRDFRRQFYSNIGLVHDDPKFKAPPLSRLAPCTLSRLLRLLPLLLLLPTICAPPRTPHSAPTSIGVHKHLNTLSPTMPKSDRHSCPPSALQWQPQTLPPILHLPLLHPVLPRYLYPVRHSCGGALQPPMPTPPPLAQDVLSQKWVNVPRIKEMTQRMGLTMSNRHKVWLLLLSVSHPNSETWPAVFQGPPLLLCLRPFLYPIVACVPASSGVLLNECVGIPSATVALQALAWVFHSRLQCFYPNSSFSL